MILLGWRRGLLKGGYHPGRNERIRRLMVLRMLQAELEAEFSEKFLNLAVQAFAPHIASKAVRNTYEDWYNKLVYITQRIEYNNERYKTLDDKLRDFAAQASKTFTALQESGALEAFDKIASEIHNRLQQN